MEGRAMESCKLNLNKDFRRLYGRGHSYVSPVVVSYFMKNRRGIIRYGITTGKKVGCAVLRNRARRVIDAAARECFSEVVCSGVDVVFVARAKTPFTNSREVAAVIKKHLISEGLIPETNE